MHKSRVEPEAAKSAAIQLQNRHSGDYRCVFGMAGTRSRSKCFFLQIGLMPVLVLYLIFMPCLTILFSSCCFCEPASGSPAFSSSSPVIYTSFLPVRCITEKICGSLASVRPIFSRGEDPSEAMPPPEIISALQKDAELVIINGAGFEKWINKVSLPLEKCVESAAELEDTFIFIEDRTSHSHGAAGLHSHHGLDGHTWLSPPNALVQAKAINQALKEVLPGKHEILDQGLAELEKSLKDLDRDFRGLMSNFKGTLAAAHPAYNYWAREYGVKILSFTLDPEEIPSQETLKALADQLKDVNPKPQLMLWEAPPAPQVARAITEATGLANVCFSPCESPASADSQEEGSAPKADFISMMRQNLTNLTNALNGLSASEGSN